MDNDQKFAPVATPCGCDVSKGIICDFHDPIMSEAEKSLVQAPVATEETAQARQFLADEILKRIAERYKNCSINIYLDFPELSPVEAVLRCAQEEGFMLRQIAPQPAGTPPKLQELAQRLGRLWSQFTLANPMEPELHALWSMAEALSAAPPPTGTPEPLWALNSEQAGRIMHKSWCETKLKQGFHHPNDCHLRTLVEIAKDLKPLHTLCKYCHFDLKPWEELPEEQKEINRHAFDALLTDMRPAALAAAPQASPPTIQEMSGSVDYGGRVTFDKENL